MKIESEMGLIRDGIDSDKDILRLRLVSGRGEISTKETKRNPMPFDLNLGDGSGSFNVVNPSAALVCHSRTWE